MHIRLADAAANLPELAALAEAGEEVVLTRGDAMPVRLVVTPARPTREEKSAALDAWENAGAQARPGPDAARSADWLYDDLGLPA